MNLKEQLTEYKNLTWAEPREEKIQEAVSRSKAAFFRSEQDQMLSWQEFLWTQLRIIQKRWWVFQLLLLLLLWVLLVLTYQTYYVQRCMGVAASLFVILVIPELWRNRSCQCMEIEGASYYSLKRIYAARMLLFGITDIFLITVFCWMASAGLDLGLTELIVQFLFPLTVTACICFGTLCSRYSFNEATAIGFCFMWSAVWVLIILDENIYAMIAFPIWFALLGAAFLFLAIMVYRILRCCNHHWEVLYDGNKVS